MLPFTYAFVLTFPLPPNPLFLSTLLLFNPTVFVGFVSLSVIHMEKGIVLLSVYTEDLTTQSVS